MINRLREIILDFRTSEPDMALLFHLSFIKFPLNDPNCQYNLIEIYDQFFLSDRTEAVPGEKVRSLKKLRSRRLLPHVVRACNQPQLDPVFHTLGRGIVRILSSSPQMLQDMEEGVIPTDMPEDPVLKQNISAYLPEMTLAFTALSKAPCKPGWTPCMTRDDLKFFYEKLNASGISLVDVQATSLHRRATEWSVLDSIYCVATSLECDNNTNCPNEEDEDGCPRPVGKLDNLFYHHDRLDTAYVDDRTASIAGPSASSAKTPEEDNEFQHHTSIIVGLLGFFTMCGLFSASMTLINRPKQAKKRSLSGICNKLFFESGTSIVTTLETGSVLQLKNDHIKTRCVVNHKSSSESTEDPKATETNTFSNEDHELATGMDVEEDRQRSCVTFCNLGNKSTRVHDPTLESKRFSDSSLADELSEGHPKLDSLNEISSKELSERFDRATKPISYIHKTAASNIWNPAKSNPIWLNSMHSEQQQQHAMPPKQYVNEFRHPRTQERYFRSAAGSFGHLPNTYVFPIEKLSDVVYHCGSAERSTPLNRNSWCQSGPLPLVAKQDTQQDFDPHALTQLHEAHSARCLATEKPGTGPQPDYGISLQSDIYEAYIGQSPTGKYPSGRDAAITKRTMVEQTGLFIQRERRVNLGEMTERRHSKGGAPKRARYSDDPSVRKKELDFILNSIKLDHQTLNNGLNHSADKTLPSLWTSSDSTNGELLDDNPQALYDSTTRRTTAARAVAAPGWTRQLVRNNATVIWPSNYRDTTEQFDSETQTESSATGPNNEGYQTVPEPGFEATFQSTRYHDVHRNVSSETCNQWASQLKRDRDRYVHMRQVLPCNCGFRETKSAFPSSLSMTDQRVLNKTNRVLARNASLEDIRTDQPETSEQESSEAERTNYDHNHTGSHIDRISFDAGYRASDSQSGSNEIPENNDQLRVTQMHKSPSTIIITCRDGIKQMYREERL
ncbi:hypothetical protein AHF37_00293 [Paragonimus kellicotti]|nr:hypothetical protein AHF37_00293 [Paragonimus kellicotti]